MASAFRSMVLSVTQNTGDHKPLLVQAPVRALDPDGLAVVTSGTVAFAIGAVVCWLWREQLVLTGRLWYLYVAILGTVMGLVGIAFGLFRGSRRRTPAGRALVEDPEVDADGVPDRE